MRRIATLLLLCWPLAAAGEAPDLDRAVDAHIMPGYEALARESAALANTAKADCGPDSPALRAAFYRAFDAWVSVSHLRFGPSETDNRAFALAFWPDTRGATPRTLAQLIAVEDPVVESRDAFTAVSVAARGFYALEYLLFDPEISRQGEAAYRCALTRAIAEDIAANADAIRQGWADKYGVFLREAGRNDVYRTENEARQQLFTALSAGLEFTADMRLGRPLGDFDRPRPNRAEARRSGRSLRHVELSLEANRGLAAVLTTDDPELDAAFARALDRAATLDDPVFAGVATPQGRIRIEALKQAVEDIRRRLALDVGPRLGLTAGFNALDGD